MTRLPTTIEQPGPRGTVSRGTAVDFSGLDNVLQGAAREVQRFDEARKAADDEVAGRILQEARQSYDLAAAERASQYDGRDPGWSARELQAFDAHFTPLLASPDVPDGVRDSLTRQSRALRAEVGAQAIAVEVRARGARSAADRTAAEQRAAIGAIMTFSEAFDSRADALRDAWDGRSPGYADTVLGAFREERDNLRETLPPDVWARVEPTLLSREVTLLSEVGRQEDEARDAGTLATVRDAGLALVNRASRDPSIAARFDEEFAPIRAAAPAYLIQALEGELRRDVNVAALDARIALGQFAAVESELDSGAYDWLPPEAVATLRENAKAAGQVRTRDDYIAAQNLEVELSADITAVLTTGRGDPSINGRINEMLGPERAAEHAIAVQAAQTMRPFITRIRTLTPIEGERELAALRAGATTAAALTAYTRAEELWRTDQAARVADPANWAMSSITAGDSGENLMISWRGLTESPTPNEAERYARATLLVQEVGGVAENNRRVLPRAAAQSLVAQLDARNAEPGEILASMAGYARLFGPHERRVLGELKEAGLEDADFGALRHFTGNPVALTRYVNARSAPPLTDNAQEQAVIGAVEVQMRDYLRSIEGQRGGAVAATSTTAAVLTIARADVARGVRPEEAARRAAELVTGNYDYRDTWRLPRGSGMSVDTVAERLRQVRNDTFFRPGQLRVPPIEGLTPSQAEELYRAAVRDDSVWQTTADDQAFELLVPDVRGELRPVLGRDGQPIRRTLNELRRPTRPGQRY